MRATYEDAFESSPKRNSVHCPPASLYACRRVHRPRPGTFRVLCLLRVRVESEFAEASTRAPRWGWKRQGEGKDDEGDSGEGELVIEEEVEVIEGDVIGAAARVVACDVERSNA